MIFPNPGTHLLISAGITSEEFRTIQMLTYLGNDNTIA